MTLGEEVIVPALAVVVLTPVLIIRLFHWFWEMV